MAEKIFHLCGSQIRGRSASPVKLNHGAIRRNALAHVFDISFQGFQVGKRDFFIFLNGNIAGAEQTEALAKGNMHVKRKRRSFFFRARVKTLQIVGTEILFPHRRGGIAGVTRAGPIIFLERGVADLGDLELVSRFHFHFGCHAPVAYAVSARDNTGADFPAATNALALSTGVVGRIPWPRFKMWPMPPVFSTAACAASRTACSRPSKMFGSTFPCSATLPPNVCPNVARASAKSVRQSTLMTSAPVSGRLSSKCAEPLANKIFGTC